MIYAQVVTPIFEPTGTLVIGAVNYDQDLHFASYYLRASLSNRTRGLYLGYSNIIAIYRNFCEIYYLQEDECRSTALELISRVADNPGWFFSVLREIQARSANLSKAMSLNDIHILDRLSNKQLLALYQSHDRAQSELYELARVPEALDRGQPFFTEHLQRSLLTQGVSVANLGHVFADLTRSDKRSVLREAEDQFHDLVGNISADVKLAQSVMQNTDRSRMLLPATISRLISEFVVKWQFLRYHGYGDRRLLTPNDVLKRIAEELRARPSSLAGSGTSTPPEGQTQIKGLDPTLFQLYTEIGRVKLHRRVCQLQNFYYLDLLLEEIARRLEVTEWMVRCMLPEEVIACLDGDKSPITRAAGRMEACAYLLTPDDEQILTGQDALEYALKAEHGLAERHDHSLRGATACAGKVKGRVRVVRRAADASNFSSGDILVSSSTDPDLLPFMAKAAAIVTEQGGVTSHAALISRELGIPAIVGVHGLLASLADGDEIVVNADEGLVEAVRRPMCPGLVAVEGLSFIELSKILGQKGARLVELERHGFPTLPVVFVLFSQVERLVSSGDEAGMAELVQQVKQNLALDENQPLAIRTSAAHEDDQAGSHAGELRSFLAVPAAEVVDALVQFVERNAFVCGTRYRGSVMFQPFIHAEFGGVCITRDTRLWNENMLVLEVAHGGSRNVTNGQGELVRLYVDRMTGDIKQSRDEGVALVEIDLDVPALVRVFLKVELHFAWPCDLEWVVFQGRLLLLQVRPVPL